MALILKDVKRPSGSSGRFGTVDQWIQVTQANQTTGAGLALPASTTGQLFRVRGGRCLVQMIIGEVTTIIQAQATTLKLSSKKLDNSSVAVGTAVDICATVDGNAKEVGSLYIPLGSGAAAIWSNAGAGIATLGRIPFVVPQGEIYATTVATSTGAMKWDIWYLPLDAGAFIEPAVLSSGLLTAAI